MSHAAASLIAPYGGALVDLMAQDEARLAALDRATSLPSIRLSPRSTCDLELLATGAFSPLKGFMRQADYERVLEEMRLTDGTLFPVPITLPVMPGDAVRLGAEIALRGPTNQVLAVMRIEELYSWDYAAESKAVYGTTDNRHPLVAEMGSWPGHYAAGPLRMLNLPGHLDFRPLRRTPAEVRSLLGRVGCANVVAFQTRNPMHRVHEELTKRAASQVDGALLIHPVVGLTKPGDVDYFTRVRTYRALVENHYDMNRTVLSLLPLAMRMAGPREAVWHAIIRRNYGANHFIVGRDHAGPGVDSKGKPFYGPYAAQELLARHSEEIGVKMVPFEQMVYVPAEERYATRDEIAESTETRSLSGSQVRSDYLAKGRPLPPWFSRPEVAEILLKENPPQHQQGFCVWFTGLPSSGKSTLAQILTVRLNECGRRVTVLDGDIVRTHLSKGLGFSKEDRDINIRRIGFVASEIVKHGGVVVCAAVSPYDATRNVVRNAIGEEGFVLVHVDTPLVVCEERDVKQIYARARRGELSGVTGIDDPYEKPANADVVVKTVDTEPDQDVETILEALADRGFLAETAAPLEA
jgi:sulfate adenylyltransferase